MISFFSLRFRNPVKRVKDVKYFLINILHDHFKTDGEINIIFVDDAYLLKINEEFLNHFDYTDTITFPYHDKDSQVIIGDIYISYERIRENAHEYKCSVQEELLRVIIHGILHLLGYEDKQGDSKMLEIQEDYLRKFFN